MKRTTPRISSTDKPSLDNSGLGRNVVALGWVAFFGGLAQDMIQPILPVFFTSVLGLNKEFIGLIEGSSNHHREPDENRRWLPL